MSAVEITDTDRWEWVRANITDLYLWIDGYSGYPRSALLDEFVERAIVKERREEADMPVAKQNNKPQATDFDEHDFCSACGTYSPERIKRNGPNLCGKCHQKGFLLTAARREDSALT